MANKLPQYFKAYLDERFDAVDRQLVDINTHLVTLNGQVEENTNFRQRAVGQISVIASVGTLAIVFLFDTIRDAIKSLLGRG